MWVIKLNPLYFLLYWNGLGIWGISKSDDYLISHCNSASASLGRPRKASKILLPVLGIMQIPTSFVVPSFWRLRPSLSCNLPFTFPVLSMGLLLTQEI